MVILCFGISVLLFATLGISRCHNTLFLSSPHLWFIIDLLLTVPRRYFFCCESSTLHGFEDRMWDVIVLIPDHCLSIYFPYIHIHSF